MRLIFVLGTLTLCFLCLPLCFAGFQAVETKAIVVCTSTSIKAFMLKFIELLNQLEELHTTSSIAIENAKNKGKKKEMRALQDSYATQSSALREQIEIANRILRIFRTSSLLLDEVDMILHPLKSQKTPQRRHSAIAWLRASQVLCLRWEWHRGVRCVELTVSVCTLCCCQASSIIRSANACHWISQLAPALLPWAFAGNCRSICSTLCSSCSRAA